MVEENAELDRYKMRLATRNYIWTWMKGLGHFGGGKVWNSIYQNNKC